MSDLQSAVNSVNSMKDEQDTPVIKAGLTGGAPCEWLMDKSKRSSRGFLSVTMSNKMWQLIRKWKPGRLATFLGQYFLVRLLTVLMRPPFPLEHWRGSAITFRNTNSEFCSSIAPEVDVKTTTSFHLV